MNGRSRYSPWLVLARRWALALLLAGALAGVPAGCGGGYETTTGRGDQVKEWHLPLEGGKVEAMAVWPPGDGPRPALLLIHEGTGRAQHFRRSLFRLSREGLVAMSISLPGFGDSTGPEDFAGPRSVAAVLKAVKYLSERQDVLKNGVVIYGSGQGATVALLAALRSPSVALLALETGVYDLKRAWRKLPPTLRERLRATLGGSPEKNPTAFRKRSPASRVGAFRGPMLIMHSKDARKYPLSESEGLAGVLRSAGRPFRFIITRGRLREFHPGHPSIKRWVIPFIGDYLPLEKSIYPER
ncbi:MAG: alpha/beta fold hydrolase [Nitrospinaceae bacterium]|jgi:dipeptidyl aminopeptidase/acylaminoacyl peptidase|nr:alpha/beta fold hydrolase [Nitrospinaceae bacterium]MBT3435323.1 alpha/beta fold hydrolase [Nitrospinaceae bacterium]MBT3820610.1 alpha/beta fold hydrolase [Nitrospinaceae bacterium]MBT5948846.1 alpha/beta fold hydrolase [Nitrospinaceae bacterium]MBT6393776.1 alpha/beta fold hydrolase [Nitrospinaceae bacterium]